MFGHKHAQQTHRQQLMNELSHSVDALRRAAGHFAQDTAERITPAYDRARYAAGRGWESGRQTVTPLYDQIREGASRARMNRTMKNTKMQGAKLLNTMQSKMPGNAAKLAAKKKAAKMHGGRMRGLATLLAAGAAVGAAGAAVARRRRAHQAEWEEYDPVTGESRMGTRYGDESSYGPKSTRERMASGAASMADNVSNRAGRIADSLHERSEMMHDRSGQGAHTAPEMPPRMTGPTGPAVSVPGTTPVPPGSNLGPGPATTNNLRNDRRGDPALGFPEEP